MMGDHKSYIVESIVTLIWFHWYVTTATGVLVTELRHGCLY